MKLRTLVVEVVTKWAGEAKLKRAKDLSDQVAQSLRGLSDASSATRIAFGALADAVVSDASRMAKAVREVGGIRMPRVGGGGGSGGGSRGPSEARRIAQHERRERDTLRRSNQSDAMRAGFDAGKVAVTDAQKSLGTFATASDRAKARVADLTSQVERNRREMAALKAEALKTGDADGTLAARMKGLSVATGQTSVELGKARRELRALDGGLIETIKNTANMQARWSAMGVAAGNLISAGVTRAVHGISGALTASAKSAIDFESNLADVKKVLSDKDLARFDEIDAGIKNAAKSIGVMPNEVAALTAALAQSGIAGDELIKTTEDASKLAVAFGISGDEAGQALAKLRTGLGLSRDEVNSLTGTINELSNKLAATAPEITDAVQRVGSVAKAANISAQSTAALATSMIAAGANSEVAATGTKNFIRALGSGAAATKRQREAFAALGVDAEDVAKQLTAGGKSAEQAVTGIVSRIGKLRQEERLPVLIELFGSESIGAIGPLATNIDLLTRSFNLAGDAVAAAGSVEKEFAARSSTTDQALKKLKASVSVLAIEFGDQLLPYINEAVTFLSSKEGQDWGRDAVAQAAEMVRGFAGAAKEVVPIVIDLVKGLAGLIENLGGAGSVALLATPKIIGMAAAFGGGPGGLAAAVLTASVALGAWAGQKIWDSMEENNAKLERMRDNVAGIAESLANGLPLLDAMNQKLLQQAEGVDSNRRAFARLMIQLQGGDVEEFDRREAAAAADRGAYQDAKARQAAVDATRTAEGQRKEAARRAEHEARNGTRLPGLGSARASIGGKVDLSGMSEEEKQAVFADLSARRKTLKPSEQKMLRALSKDLDKRIPTGSGDSSFTDEQKKAIAEQRRLQGDLGGVIDENRTGFGQRFLELGKHSEEAKLNRLTAGRGGLLALLEQGRTRKKGVLGGATNELDRAVESMLEGPTPLGISGSRSGSGATAGPAISNRYEIHNSASISQEIRVEGKGDTTPERIRSAGRAVANETITGWQEAAAVFTSGST